MRRYITAGLIALMAASSAACSYGSMASHNGKLYVARNDGFLFGALRKMYECNPDGGGNMTCTELSGKP